MAEFLANFRKGAALEASFETVIRVSDKGTNDYNHLINQPKINEVRLRGNKSLEDLGLISMSNIDIEALLT